MSKAITITQTICSKVALQMDDRWTKIIFLTLLCLMFTLMAVYILQAGDLIQKTFSKLACEVRVEKAVKAKSDSRTASQTSFSLAMIEKLVAGNGFVPVERVQYIPLTTGLAAANQLVSNIR